MTQSSVAFVQTGIRQRSLRKHCRLGRATELVFVLATGIALTLGGTAQAQDLTYNVGGGPFAAPLGGTGNWATTSAEWTDGVGASTWIQGRNAIFGDSNPVGPYSVALNGTVPGGETIITNNIEFNTNGVSIVNAPDHALQVDGVIIISNAAHAATLNTDVVSGITVSGAGDLQINSSGVQSVTNAGSGTVFFNGTGGTAGTATNSGTGILNITSTVGGVVTNSGAGQTDILNQVGGLSSTGGQTNINGQAANSGEVTGATTIANSTVTVTSGKLSENSTVNVNLGGVLTINSGTVGAVTNNAGGTVTIADGTVASLSSTAGTAITQMDGGAITGTTDIDGGTFNFNGGTLGDVENAGTFSIVESETVGGNFTNSGTIDATGATADATLTISGMSGLTTSGDITSNAGGDTFTISASTIALDAGATLDGGTALGGDIVLDGAITNNTTLTTQGAVTLTGSFTNNGTLTVTDVITSGANLLTNTGTLNINTGGVITGNVTASDGTVTVNASSGGTLEVGLSLTIESDVVAGTTGALVLTDGDLRAVVNNGLTDTNGLNGTVDDADATNDGVEITVTDGVVNSLTNNSGEAVLNGGGVTTTTEVTGGTVTNNGATLTGLTTTSGTGTFTQTDGAANNGIENDGGTVNLDGGTAAALTNTANAGVSTVTDGEVIGTTTINGGSVVVNDTDADMGLELQGDTTIAAGGTLTVTAGQVDDVINNGGTVTFATGTAATSLDNNTGGDADFDGTVTVDTTITNAAALDINSGVTTASGGTTNEDDGVLTIDAGAELDSDTLNEDGANLVVAGTLDGTLTNQTTGVNSASITGDVDGAVINTGNLDVNGGSMGSLLNNAGGDADFDGASMVDNGITNFAALDVNSGSLTVQDGMGGVGTTLNQAGGTLTIVDSALLASNVTNNGITDLAGQVTGNVDGTGTLNITDNAAMITGDLTSTGASELNIEGSTTTLTVGGDANLSGNITVDATTGAVGNLNVGGNVAGNVTLTFDGLDAATAASLDNALLVNFGGTNTLNFADILGLPVGGGLDFVVDEIGNQLVLGTVTATAVNTVAATVGLTQTLVDTIVNRPTSPFVADLAAGADEKPCGVGGWVRATGGTANANGTFTDVEAGVTGESPVGLNYAGLQFGGDFACFGGHYNGWDLAFGGIAGFNDASSTSNAFSLTGVLENTLESDIFQSYAGVYATAARGRFFADLQFRFEDTQFESTNRQLDPGGLADFDAEYDNTGQTVSGAVGYSWPIGQDSGLTFVSSAGFSFTKNETDNVDLGADGTLVFEDGFSRVGFLSASLAKTRILPDEVSALSYFGTATVYNDFADDRTAFFIPTGSTTGRELAIENVGAYGELSLGLNYLRLLSPGEAGNARQLNASVRLDARFSGDVESYGITGQFRLQF